MEFELIEINRIVEDPEQPRKSFDAEALQGLAESIRQHGVLQPLRVVPLLNVNMFQLVNGERRWRAAAMAGVDMVPCIVVPRADAEETVTAQLVENLQREDLQPLDRARALEALKAATNGTNREVGARLGLSERAVGHLLDLLNLPEEIGAQVVSTAGRAADGRLTEKHARHLRLLNDLPELQKAVVEKIKGNRLSGDQTGRLVKAIRELPERASELLEGSALDFSEVPLRSGAPVAVVAERIGPRSSVAERIDEFIGTLDHVSPMGMEPGQVAQLEAALVRLRSVADALLRECRLEAEARG